MEYEEMRQRVLEAKETLAKYENKVLLIAEEQNSTYTLMSYWLGIPCYDVCLTMDEAVEKANKKAEDPYADVRYIVGPNDVYYDALTGGALH